MTQRASLPMLLGFLAALMLFGMAGRAWAEDEEDEFFRRDDRRIHDPEVLGARAVAMGGAYVANCARGNAIAENPAALGRTPDARMLLQVGWDQLDGGDVDVSTRRYLDGGVVNLNKLASLRHHANGEVEDVGHSYYNNIHTSPYGNHGFGTFYRRTDFDYHNLNKRGGHIDGVITGWGRSLWEGRLLVGLSLGYDNGSFHEDEDNDQFDHSWHRYEGKVGVIGTVRDDLALGATVTYAKGRYDTDSEDYPLTDGDTDLFEGRIGLAWTPNDRLVLQTDGSYRRIKLDDMIVRAFHKHDIFRFSLGAEYNLVPNAFQARGGFWTEYDDFSAKNGLIDSAKDTVSGFTLGARVRYRWFLMDYGFEVRSTGDFRNDVQMILAW